MRQWWNIRNRSCPEPSCCERNCVEHCYYCGKINNQHNGNDYFCGKKCEKKQLQRDAPYKQPKNYYYKGNMYCI